MFVSRTIVVFVKTFMRFKEGTKFFKVLPSRQTAGGHVITGFYCRGSQMPKKGFSVVFLSPSEPNNNMIKTAMNLVDNHTELKKYRTFELSTESLC